MAATATLTIKSKTAANTTLTENIKYLNNETTQANAKNIVDLYAKIKDAEPFEYALFKGDTYDYEAE